MSRHFRGGDVLGRPSVKIGDSALRTEDEPLLRGLGCFLDDVPCPTPVLHACFVRSTHAHAIIREIDTTNAKSTSGVATILTAADLEGLLAPIQGDFERPGYHVTTRSALASDRVRFVGDAIALVLAEDLYSAYDVAELVTVDYEPLEAAAEIGAALARTAPRLHESAPGNILFEGTFQTPEFESVMNAADFRIRERFRASRVAPAPLESRGCIAQFDPALKTLTFWSSTQVPHLLRSCLAEHLSLPDTKVRVITPDVGGGFGMKASVYPEELVVAAASIKYGMTVKWVQDRYDDFLSSTQARGHEYELEVGYDRNGVVQALRADVSVSVGAYASLPFGSSLEPNGVIRHMPGALNLRHFSYRTRAVATNTPPTGPFRGVAAPVTLFTVCGLLDRIARKLGLDPADVIRRNLVSSFPYDNVLGQRYTEGCFVESLDRLLVISDYDGLRRRQKEKSGINGRYYGIGIAVITEQTGMGASRYKARGLLRVPGYESATVKIEPSGHAIAYVSQAAAGQGHHTTFAQIAADALGLPLDAVTVVEGDTGLVPFGTGTFASRGVIIAGGAVRRAAIAVADKVKRIAAHVIECSPQDLTLRNGGVFIEGVPDAKLSLSEISGIAHSLDDRLPPPGESYGLFATETHDTPTAMITSMAHLVSVMVDARTGKVEIDRYKIVHDCGTIVNPALVDGQIHGGVLQGLGEVLMETMAYDAAGQLLTANLMDYQLPRISDAPKLDIEEMHAIDRGGEVTFKGIGEGGTIGAVPALANAIADALAPIGVEVNSLPLRSCDIIELIADANRRKAEGGETENAHDCRSNQG